MPAVDSLSIESFPSVREMHRIFFYLASCASYAYLFQNLKRGAELTSFNELLCPKCGEALKKESLKRRLYCPHCKTDLKSETYIDFLEYLVEQGIVDNVDFFDTSLFGNDFLKYEANEMDDEHDISDTENGNLHDFLDDNMISIEDEFISDMESTPSGEDDYPIFDTDDLDDEDDYDEDDDED